MNGWLDTLKSYLGITSGGEKVSADKKPDAVLTKQPIVHVKTKRENPKEIKIVKELTDEQIQARQARKKYISETKNPDYTVKKGDTISDIAKKFGVEVRSILALNGIDYENGNKLKIGQVLKIPPTKKISGVKNLTDVAKSMGVSEEFIKGLKRIEDNGDFKENQFHNTPYKDDAGVWTIGIGHVLKAGEPRQLNNEQVCSLLAKDLLAVEDNLKAYLGEKKYNDLPQPLKEALLDMVFNKGLDIIEKTEGLKYCLKEGKYEAAINKFTHVKSTKTGEEMSGLCKRRLFDISVACKMYDGKIPQSNINTSQQIYNKGIALLRKSPNFANLLPGFNKDVESYFGKGIIKLTTK